MLQSYAQAQQRSRSQKTDYSVYDHVQNFQKHGGPAYYDELRQSVGDNSRSAPNARDAAGKPPKPQYNGHHDPRRHPHRGRQRHQEVGRRGRQGTDVRASLQDSSDGPTREPENGLYTPRLRPHQHTLAASARQPLPPIKTHQDRRHAPAPKQSVGQPELSRSGQISRNSSTPESLTKSVNIKMGSWPSSFAPSPANKRPPSFRTGGYFLDSHGNLRESRSDYVKSSFDAKFDELYDMKKQAQLQMNKFNAIKLDFMDWFKRKHTNFLASVKSTQLSAPQLIPQDVKNISHLRLIAETCRHLAQKTRNPAYNYTELATFIEFWDRLVEVKRETDAIFADLYSYCQSISTLRRPEVLEEIDSMQRELDLELDEDYDFSGLNNEKHNLFTYSVGVFDERYFNLVHFIPYLLRLATRMCYTARQVHLETE